jgi:hypothetical protein
MDAIYLIEQYHNTKHRGKRGFMHNAWNCYREPCTTLYKLTDSDMEKVRDTHAHSHD